MILWKDFVLDENFGALLSPELFSDDEPVLTSSRGKRLGSLSIMDDAQGTQIETTCNNGEVSFQETRQEQRPARMVGLSSLDSAQSHTDVSRGDRVENLRRRGEA